MSQEQQFDLNSWWGEQSFPEKELFSLDEHGVLTLRANTYIKERVIATLPADSAETVVANLREKFAQADAKVNEVEVEWIAAEDKLKMADKVAHLKEHLDHVAAIGDFERLGKLVHSWEHTIYELTEENYKERLKVVEMAEGLAQSDMWKETTQIFKDITDQWKTLGHIDRNRNDKLWNRIEAARKTFHDRKREHHTEEEKDLLQNLDLKIDLVEQAEAITNSTEWKKTSETYHRLTEEWKTIGPTLNKKNEELWQRFMTAKSTFFERKREHSTHVQQEQEANYAKKLVLVEKAEALRESTEWNATAQAFAALMEEWKKTGRVGQEKGDELWKRFTEAQEQFFSAKRQHSDATKQLLDQNYALKEALLRRAEQVKNSSNWGTATTEMNELFDEWKKIGPIARAHGNKMWEDFIGARKHFFARKDANRDQRKQYAETQKEARIEHAKAMVVKLRDEIREEEERLADFKNGLENISPGKKAGELKAHLEKLITECAAKIKRLKEKYAAVTDEHPVAAPDDNGQTEA